MWFLYPKNARPFVVDDKSEFLSNPTYQIQLEAVSSHIDWLTLFFERKPQATIAKTISAFAKWLKTVFRTTLMPVSIQFVTTNGQTDNESLSSR